MFLRIQEPSVVEDEELENLGGNLPFPVQQQNGDGYGRARAGNTLTSTSVGVEDVPVVTQRSGNIGSGLPFAASRTAGGTKCAVPAVQLNEISSVLPFFSGVSDENVDYFISVIQHTKTVFAVDDEIMKLVILKQLKGGAQIWSMSMNLLSKEYGEVIEILKNTFATNENTYVLRKKLDMRKWRSNESFQEYSTEKRILAGPLKLEEEELIDYLIEGIPDQVLRNQARIAHFKTVADLTKAFGIVQMKPLVCYSCNKPGHVAVNCWNRTGIIKHSVGSRPVS